MNKEKDDNVCTVPKSKEDKILDSTSYAMGLCIGLILGKLVFDNIALGLALAPAFGFCFNSFKQKKI